MQCNAKQSRQQRQRHQLFRSATRCGDGTRRWACHVVLRSDWPSSPHPLAHLPLQLAGRGRRRHRWDNVISRWLIDWRHSLAITWHKQRLTSQLRHRGGKPVLGFISDLVQARDQVGPATEFFSLSLRMFVINCGIRVGIEKRRFVFYRSRLIVFNIFFVYFIFILLFLLPCYGE